MKSVLISVKPKFCEKIASGEKTIEVRKTRPKLETPFKCLIYQTKSRDNAIYKQYKVDDIRSGKVIGEFICDRIDEYILILDYKGDNYATSKGWRNFPFNEACLSREEVVNYGKGKTLYGWHISDLKIYDKPKGLNEFTPFCEYKDERCGYCSQYVETFGGCCKTLKRPPKSWQYIETQGESNG